MTQPPGQESARRHSEQYVARSRKRKLWKRSMVLAHGRRQSELLRHSYLERKSRLRKAESYLKIMAVLWVYHYLKSRFGGKYPFPDYDSIDGDNGIYALKVAQERSDSEQVRISLAGDWGSGTEEAQKIGECISQDSPDFTIHLGDIYYVGERREVKQNMLSQEVRWPRGSCGSFALNANHEMYARGKAYFTELLPQLGIRGDSTLKDKGQRASYFCLRNEHWLVIGLDTGYHSVGIPIIEHVFKPGARLHRKQMEWLQEEVGLQDDEARGVVLLSHHQYYSAFESGYEAAAVQLAQLVKRPVLWFWGHEHRFAIYGKHATKGGGLEAYGRCIGHGGLPIEDIVDRPKRRRKYQVGLVLYDRRERTLTETLSVPVGFNGYANLVFKGRELVVEYKDDARVLVRETWRVGGGGVLEGVSIDRRVTDGDLAVHIGASLADAIG